MNTTALPVLVASAFIVLIFVDARRPSRLRLSICEDALRVQITGKDAYSVCPVGA